MKWSRGRWVGGLARWENDGTVYYSIAFTWKLDEAFAMALFDQACGKKVVAGGPALFLRKMAQLPGHELEKVATIGGVWDMPDAVRFHNPMATSFSFGCDVGCAHCIVPAMHGKKFTLAPDAPVRPVLCDNNLSALPPEYQQHIIRRYRDEGVPLLDANSGFEPRTFTEDVYRRWAPLVNEGGGPWRFGYDDMQDQPFVRPVFKMLAGENQKRKRVYVLIGNEPYAECMGRIREVIDAGCEPHVQPEIKLTALDRRPWVRHDWTEQKLADVARWANGWVWKRAAFEDYDRHRRSVAPERYDEQEGMFT